MSMFDHIEWVDLFRIMDPILGRVRNFGDFDPNAEFVAMTQDGKYMVAHYGSIGFSYVIEYSHDHEPVQADAFVKLRQVEAINKAEDFSRAFEIEELDDKQRSIVATALKASLSDVKAFDPVTPAGKVAPVRLCPMGAYVDAYALLEVMALFDEIGPCPHTTYPLSYTELDGRPFMALRTVDYKNYDRQKFRMRITACIPMEVHRVKDFNEMVHDVFGYKREDD